MTKYEKYKDVPHFDLIKDGETIVIPSIFMFESNVELYPFLRACEEYNCTVFFENEKLTVPPKSDEETRLKLLCYSTVMNCREIGNAYVRYLGGLALMQWR
jgi:hypothetical protein